MDPIPPDTPATAGPPPARPQGCTNFKLRQLSRRMTQHYDAEMAQAGLKITQYSLLSHVVKLGPIRPVDLAGHMKMDTSTLSRNLRPLMQSGWLEQVPGPDARSHLIAATAAGRDKRQEAQRRWKAAQESINQLLGAERVAALHALMDDAMHLLTPLEHDGAADDLA